MLKALDMRANLPFAIYQECKVDDAAILGSVSSPVHWEHNACMTNPILIVIPPYLKIDDPGNQSSY